MELDVEDEDKENEEEEGAAGGDALPMPILGRRNPAGGAPNFIPEPSPAANFETLEDPFPVSLVSFSKIDEGCGVVAFAGAVVADGVSGVLIAVEPGTDHFRTGFALGAGTAASFAAFASSACFFIKASLSLTVIDFGSPLSAMFRPYQPISIYAYFASYPVPPHLALAADKHSFNPIPIHSFVIRPRRLNCSVQMKKNERNLK